MALHKTSGRWQLGMGLALLTVVCWGALPIVLMLILRELDAMTACWFRFLVASSLLGLILFKRGTFPRLRGLTKFSLFLVTIATLGLAGNYYAFLQSLAYISPGTAQVMIQIAPLILVVSSVVIFKEPFSWLQRLGVLMLIPGLGFFFNTKLVNIFNGTDTRIVGIYLILFASVAWAIYAAAQKQLLTSLSSQGVLFFIYAGSAVLFTPLAHLSGLVTLSGLGWGLLIFSALNTVVAYGAFSEAMRHLEASRVSAILALTPVASLASVEIVAVLWPSIVSSENMALIGYFGAFLVVAGSALTALGAKRVSKTLVVLVKI